MKYIFTLALFFVSICSFSQSEEEKIYDRYLLKSRIFTGNQVALMNENLYVKRMGPKSFYIEININPSESFVIGAEYEGSFEFAGNTFYSYNGLGRFDDVALNFSIESRTKLGDVTKGKAFVENSDDSLDDFEIHIFFWPYETSEPLAKSNMYVFPIAQSTEQDYIQHDGWKELNVPHVLKRTKYNSTITGTYETKYGNVLQLVELTDGKILFKLSVGNERNIGFLNGLVDLEGNVALYENYELGVCKFRLEIKTNQVNISTVENGNLCGFGNGLYADGTFLALNKDLPVLLNN
ncbi:MAG TPA: hypothetical protein VFM70_04535 [Salinimicrobium sp.]|nr:hypothetical protein [Salinimicrobium sp.]